MIPRAPRGYAWLVPAAILCTLAVCACAEMEMIPDKIESGRIRPQANVELPQIQSVSDAVDYFFEPRSSWAPQNGEAYPIVHMRIPKGPYFDKDASSGPVRKYEMYITMYYPNFSGLADEENAECRIDAKETAGNFGYCRRELSVGFGFGFEPSHSEALLRRNLENNVQLGYIKPTNKISKYPGLELVGIERTGELENTYYRSRDAQGHAEFVIRCNEDAPSPVCDTAFRATKSPYIYVQLDFVLALLPQWKEVITATRKKVDSMIIDTYYLQPKE